MAGMKFQGRFFNVYPGGIGSSLSGRVDIVVSTKISKKATVRNRIRRQVKEIIRNYRKIGNFLTRDLKIVVLSSIPNQKFSKIKEDLENILNRIK